MTTIRVEGAEELIKQITKIQSMTKVKTAIRQAAILLQGYLKQYPSVSRRPNPLIKMDDRVRRGFFYHLKHGDIDVPYRRGQSPGSEKLGQSWTTTTENSGFRAIVGTGVSYAPLVQDSEQQASYHRHTGWITTRQVEMLHGQEAINIIEQALRREVNNG